MIDQLRDKYDELEDIVETLRDLSNRIEHYKDIAEQIDALWCDVDKEFENVGADLAELEAAENRELEYGYERSRF